MFLGLGLPLQPATAQSTRGTQNESSDALIALGGSVWLCVPLGHYTREALHQGTRVCPPPCAQMAGHKAILWQPHLVDRAKGLVPFKESLRRLASLSGS